MKKNAINLLQEFKDLIFLPLRAALPNNELSIQNWLGLTPLSNERFNIVLNNMTGLALDVGCGNNKLINLYCNKDQKNTGFGLDITTNKSADIITNDSSKLPFKNSVFDTISFVGSLNHIPNRNEVIIEAARVLRKNGQILITMLSPFIGWFGHRILWRYWGDPDQHHSDREIHPEEKWGLSDKEISSIAESAELYIAEKKKFAYGLNNFYCLKKK